MKRTLVVVGIACAVTVLLGVVFVASGTHKRGSRHSSARVADATSAMRPQAARRPMPGPVRARELAYDINRLQEVIHDRASPNTEFAAAALSEQLATGALERETARERRTTLALLRPRVAAAMRTNLAAGAALSRLTVPGRQFPRWTIAEPARARTLLGYFRAAQSRFGVGWQYLAAIEFIETRFGRIHGPSSAGAQGPMQFLPSTWARYGSGNIDNERDAIFATARYLLANGAPGDMATALYRYNNSTDYVAAVQDYAGRIRADPPSYDGYYNWQVLYARAGGVFILPVGYPRVRAEAVHYP